MREKIRIKFKLTVLVVVDLVGHGEQGGVLLDPVLHRVHQVLVRLHYVLFQYLQKMVRKTKQQFARIVTVQMK